MNFINSKISEIKEKCFGKEIELYESESAKEALSDVMIILALMYKDHKLFLSNERPLYLMIADVVASEDILKKLEGDDKKEGEQKGGVVAQTNELVNTGNNLSDGAA